MENDYTQDMYEWTFPEVEIISCDNNENNSQELVTVNDETNSEDKVDKETTINQEEVRQSIALIENDEVDKIKAIYNEKIDIVNSIIKKLKYPMSIIDDELIEILLDLIKKTIAKLIHKEIQQDPNIFNQMINELISLIQSKDGMVTIYTSAQDYDRLNSDNNPTFNLTSIDNALSEGDVIIKSNASEVRAILNERIDNLLRIQYG